MSKIILSLFIVLSIFLKADYSISKTPANSDKNKSAFHPADDFEKMKCKKKLAALDTSWKSLPLNEIIVNVGKTFTGTPYVAGTLDENPNEESVVVCVTGLDCVTFVENCLVMSILIKKGKVDFENYKKELEKIRYRNGVNEGYSSRLHYFTDWIYDNEQKGIVTDITKEIGGVPYDKNIDFMTNHTGSYKQLSNNPENVSKMQEAENNINSRQLYYIPKENVSAVYDKLQTGDIIGITSNLGGLDVAHTGYVYKENGGTYLLNASLKDKQVEISPVELQEYMMGNSKQGGIVVARVKDIK